MKIILKILKVTAILIIALTVLLFSASLLLQDKVAEIVLNSLSKSLTTKFDVGSVKLSFLRKFPKASLELNNVVVYSSKDFNSEQFIGINTDTLAVAKFVSVEFQITDIIRGNYTIERVGAKNGKLNLFSDLSGFVNYDVSVKSDNPGNETITIDLKKINLNNIKVYYNNIATKLIITSIIHDGKLKSKITGDNIDFTAAAETDTMSFHLYNFLTTKPVKAFIDMTLRSTKEGIRINKGLFSIENFKFGIDGFISSDDILDLNMTGQNIDISKIRKYLPEKYLNLVSDYNPSGILFVDCKIEGPLTRTKNPHIEIDCNLDKGHITYGKSILNIDNLAFSGHFTNGSGNNPESSSVSFKNISATLGSSNYTGSFSIIGFDKPRCSLALKGRVYPHEIKEFFKLDNISEADGYTDTEIKMVTDIWPLNKITIADIIDSKPDADFIFSDFSIGFKNNQLLVNNVNGSLSFSDIVKANNLSLKYKSQNINVTGEFRNLPEWFMGRPVQLAATADIYFDKLIPEAFLENNSTQDSSSAENKAYSFPDDLVLDINFKIDKLNYKTYSSSLIKGSLTYKPRLLTFKSLTLLALNGNISGNGFVAQNKSKSIMARGNFNLTKIDVNEAFKTFHNFGQDFIKAENISGDLSGTLSVLLPLDSLLNPQIKSLSAEGKYTLLNGALIDFDPIKELSTFIELSELENIHFEKLENDFFIKNNFVYVPQMDVKSSAADLSVSGKHSFDNDYEYHVKMLLSELLSKKRKKNKSNVTEFGVVEDDGLGRTSLLLKVVNKGEDVKVTYDIKAAETVVKKNIKSERQTLKTILNQEYGWYKSDTTVKAKPAEKKTKFRISWDETDSTKNKVNPPEKKKENSIKNIFKKK